ncbi:MAG: ferredoxin [Candidatus Marinimicrobia bacterium]|nr:ferredoxin [Candidatus Neomarinimicrobiota bacterium]
MPGSASWRNRMLYVDPDLCTGCEACVKACPEGFSMENGIAIVKDPDAPCVLEAQRICPVSAIRNNGPGSEAPTMSRNPVPPSTGRGFASGQGSGGGGFRGRGPGKRGGPGGYCVCPRCGHKEPHRAGQPCYQMRCPECNALMTR